MKLLTLIVPCYNSAEGLESTLNGILPCGEAVEIIVVNDGSTDAAASVAEELCQRYPDTVRVVHQQHMGHGECINVGVALAQGRYVKLVECGDVINAEVLAALTEKIASADLQADVLVTNCELVLGNKTHLDELGAEFCADEVLTWQQTRLSSERHISPYAVAFRTELCARSVGLPASMLGDGEYWTYSLIKHAENIFYLPVVLYTHYMRDVWYGVTGADALCLCKGLAELAVRVMELYHVRDEITVNNKRGRYLYRTCKAAFGALVAACKRCDDSAAASVCKDAWQTCDELDLLVAADLRRDTQSALCGTVADIVWADMPVKLHRACACARGLSR